MTDTRITKRCKLYLNEVYNAGNIGYFIDLLLERIKHPLLSEVEFRVVGHGGSDLIEFEVSGIEYEGDDAL